MTNRIDGAGHTPPVQPDATPAKADTTFTALLKTEGEKAPAKAAATPEEKAAKETALGKYPKDFAQTVANQASEPGGSPLLLVPSTFQWPFRTGQDKPIIVVTDPHGVASGTKSVLDMALRLTGGKADIDINGDVNDKGPDTLKLVDYLMDLKASHTGGTMNFGIGNHEDTMRSALADLGSTRDLSQIHSVQAIDNVRNTADIIRAGENGHDPVDVAARAGGWVKVAGGATTLQSYGIDPQPFIDSFAGLSKNDPEPLLAWHSGLRQALLDHMPAEHVAFFKSDDLQMMRQHGDIGIVHAGVNWTQPLQQQDPINMLWTRGDFHRYEGPVHESLPRLIDAGHTSVAKPDIKLWTLDSVGGKPPETVGRAILDVGTVPYKQDLATIHHPDGLEFIFRPRGADQPRSFTLEQAVAEQLVNFRHNTTPGGGVSGR